MKKKFIVHSTITILHPNNAFIKHHHKTEVCFLDSERQCAFWQMIDMLFKVVYHKKHIKALTQRKHVMLSKGTVFWLDFYYIVYQCHGEKKNKSLFSSCKLFWKMELLRRKLLVKARELLESC